MAPRGLKTKIAASIVLIQYLLAPGAIFQYTSGLIPVK